MSAAEGSAGEGAHTDMKLEVVVIPVDDVDRAKEFYLGLGWRLDADASVGDDFRIVQITPPGSDCSIQFGTNVSSATPGSAEGLYLVVSEIEAARADLSAHGVEVSEVFHEGALGDRFPHGAANPLFRQRSRRRLALGCGRNNRSGGLRP